MKVLHKLFESAHVLIVIAFFLSALTLVVFSIGELWGAIRPGNDVSMQARLVAVLECIGLLTIAVAALELGQTILEEEVQRSSPISAPTRVRRFLSRFIVVVVVALSIECLVAVFQFIHDAPERLPHAASVGLAAAALLAAWGVFVKLNVAAEVLEPEGMEDAKEEDEKVGPNGDDEGSKARNKKRESSEKGGKIASSSGNEVPTGGRRTGGNPGTR